MTRLYQPQLQTLRKLWSCLYRSENYLITKTIDQTPAQLGLQPITVEDAKAQSSGSASKESIAAPAPGPAGLNTSEAAAANAASLLSSGVTRLALFQAPLHQKEDTVGVINKLCL